MSLLEEPVDSSPAQPCPSCKEGVIIKDKFLNLSCTQCNLRISKGGMVRGFSLNVLHKKYRKEQRKRNPA